jgi:predicted GIY-YIG superfamily endonuclease
MQYLDTHRQTLYRFFDSGNQLLYVGISNNWITRLNQHYKHSEWFSDVVSATFQHFETREEVEAAEKLAIQTEGAIHNKAFNPNFESPFEHFQKIKSWVYSGIEPDNTHLELIEELKIAWRHDSYWSRKTSADLALWVIDLMPSIAPDCSFCEGVFHSNQINQWANKKKGDRKNATH